MGHLLDTINNPHDLRQLPLAELPRLAGEIRSTIIDVVAKNGGHLASSLGAVELAIAVHYAFNTPDDVLFWDVGHQAYAHKLLTGRRDAFATLRRQGGISGFPNKDESPLYDVVTCGHSSTSISTALGLLTAHELAGKHEKVIVVIGDASLAGGMSFEALNHTGHMKKDLVIILNDNELSISHSVGGLSKYLNRIITNPAYNKIRLDVEKVLKRIPRFGFRAYRAARRLEEGLKNLLVPGMLFEEMGLRYFGPIDGHNIAQLVRVFRNVGQLNEPILIHVVTKKGKGYRFAEERPADFHGTGPFDIATGQKKKSEGSATFTDAFGAALTALAADDQRIVAVTAAMVDGTGLTAFAKHFPERFFDVGIAEEHAIGLSAGFARAGLRPFVAVYSTFLQRGYDQIIHDVALQKLPVTLCLDRAGIVGEDGPTHHGIFDIAYVRHIPDITFMAPQDPDELAAMLAYALMLEGPAAIRYPKAALPPLSGSPAAITHGRATVIREGNDIAVIAVGSMVHVARSAADLAAAYGVQASVINARFIKPLDEELILRLARSGSPIITIEEGALEGGFGSAVLECIERAGIRTAAVTRLGLPNAFIEHGTRDELLTKYGLTPQAICDVIVQRKKEAKTTTYAENKDR